MRPSKLKIHLDSNHPQHKDEDVTYFQRLADRIKCWRLDADGVVHAQNAGIEASFRISLEIAKHKKPHNIAEELILPCIKIMNGLILGRESVNVPQVPLSNNTVKRRILKMSEDIEEQVVSQIKQAGMFSLQLDESTDVAAYSQLMIFIRYAYESSLKEECLFCKDLKSTT